MSRAFHISKLLLSAGIFVIGISFVSSILFFSDTQTVSAQDLSVGGFLTSFGNDLTEGTVLDDIQRGVTHPGDVARSVGSVVRGVANGQSVTQAVENAGTQLEHDIAQSDAACALTDMLCRAQVMIMQIITGILGLIITFLGLLVTFAVQILIGFATYNGFASAAPVATGWVLVRDLANMFFIVIMLVSAFATIIGYDSSFHYTKVLPKLLLMAVLINFSKTLIMMLVELSQIMMLTFINAFQQASGANFIHAFKLDKITQLARCNNEQSPLIPAPAAANVAATPASTTNVAQTVTSTAAAAGRAVQGTASELSRTGCDTNTAINITTIILSYLLGIVLLIIALGVIIIMIAYLIARIIGLWVILIFSPMAFFATALPARLQKGMSVFTGDYWTKLSALLTGGPVIGFFLWLTLATVQGSMSSLPSSSLSHADEGGASAFISGVGNSQEIATFIVAIAMLLIGLDAAVSSASAVSKSVGEFAGNVSGLTKNAAKFAALSPLYLGRSGARAVDRRYDVTGKASRAALKYLPQTAGSRRVLTKGAVMRRKEREAMASEQVGDMKDMTREEKVTLANSYGSGQFASPDEKLARAKIYEDLGSDDSRFKDTKARAARIEKEMLGNGKFKGVPPDEVKRMANAKAMQEATVEGGKHLAEAKKAYLDQGDTTKAGDIDKIIEKNPALEQDAKKRKSLIEKIRLDPAKTKALTPEALSNPEVVMGLLPPGSVQEHGGKITGFDSAQIQAFKEQNKDNKDLTSNVDALIGHVSNGPIGGVEREDLLQSSLQRNGHGKVQLYNNKTGERRFNEVEKIARNEMASEITNGSKNGRASAGNLNGSAAHAVWRSMKAGMPIGEVMELGQEKTDGAVSGALATGMGKAFANAAGAKTKADLDHALNDEATSETISQIEDPGVSSQAQVKIIASIQGAGGAKAISDSWNMADSEQRKTFERVVKVAVQQATNIGKRGGPANPAEAAVVRMVQDLKNEMPRKGTPAQYDIDRTTGKPRRHPPGTPNAGKPIILVEAVEGAPPAIVKHLYD